MGSRGHAWGRRLRRVPSPARCGRPRIFPSGRGACVQSLRIPSPHPVDGGEQQPQGLAARPDARHEAAIEPNVSPPRTGLGAEARGGPRPGADVARSLRSRVSPLRPLDRKGALGTGHRGQGARVWGRARAAHGLRGSSGCLGCPRRWSNCPSGRCTAPWPSGRWWWTPAPRICPHAPTVRLAVHLGAVRVDHQATDPTAQVLAVGETLALPVRLLGQAAPGEIVITPEVGRLVDGWVALEERPLRLRAGDSTRVGGLCRRGGEPRARGVGRTSAPQPEPLGGPGAGTAAAGRPPRAGQGRPGTGRESGRGAGDGQIAAARRVSPAPHRAARPLCGRAVPGVREWDRPICPSWTCCGITAASPRTMARDAHHQGARQPPAGGPRPRRQPALSPPPAGPACRGRPARASQRRGPQGADV